MARILASLIFVLPLTAQTPGNYSIAGVVVNFVTGEPVKYALVSLMGFKPPNPDQVDVEPAEKPVQKKTQADSAGRFQFDGLAKLHYTVTAQKPGFNLRMGNEDKSGQVDLTGSISGMQLKLYPFGVIEGKVVDQNNEPLRGVNIVALQVSIVDGEKQTRSVRTVATDDRGVFRLWNLAIGRYYIKAAGKSGGTYRYVGEATPYYSSWESFTPTYSGGAHSLDAATAIEIGPGTKAAADFRLELEPAFKIRGTLAGPTTGTVTFDLLQGTEDVSASRTSVNSSTGRFEVQDVPPGAYTLRVTQDSTMRGEARVSVGDGDVNGVSISLSPAITVRSVTHVVGVRLKVKQMPGADRLIGADVDDAELNQVLEPACQVSLHGQGTTPVFPRVAPGAPVAVRDRPETGASTVGDFFPGVYRVVVGCENGYPLSVLAGGIDLIANPDWTLAPGVVPPPVEIQIKPGGGSLHGKLTGQAASPGVGVLLIPAFQSSGPVMVQLQDSEFQVKGEFEQPFLAPGDYTVYAFPDWQNVEFRNPAFLQTLRGGVSVHIEDGKESEIVIDGIVK